MKLSPRESKFVSEYLVDMNATQAAIRAGYAPKAAEVQGSRLLSRAKVRAEIDAALKRRSERTEVKADDILRELLRLAMVDVGQAFTTDGRLKPLADIPEDVRRAISGLEYEEASETRGAIRKVRFWDKTKGLELLGKHLKLFTDKVEHSGTLTLEQLVLASKKPKVAP